MCWSIGMSDRRSRPVVVAVAVGIASRARCCLPSRTGFGDAG